MFSPALSEEERSKRRRNKKERGGSLFSLRKKKDKKDGKGLAKAGSAVSLQVGVQYEKFLNQNKKNTSNLLTFFTILILVSGGDCPKSTPA